MQTKGKKLVRNLPPVPVSPETRSLLERVALAREISMSEVVREALDRYLPLQPELLQQQEAGQ
jgi:hypothetical protein